MQIAPIPTLDDETNQIRLMTADIVANQIIPNEHFLRRRDPDTPQRWGKLLNLVKEAGILAPNSGNQKILVKTESPSRRRTGSSPWSTEACSPDSP